MINNAHSLLLILALNLSILPVYGKNQKATAAPPVLAENIADLEAKGYTPLLSENTLEGWEIRGCTADFSIKDGVIKGHGKELKRNSFLCSQKEYTDFIFVFQMKFDHLKGNSGVLFRANMKTPTRPFGYQCEHDQNTKRSWTAGLFDEARRGWLYPRASRPRDSIVLPPETIEFSKAFTQQGQEIFKADDWNTIIIKCKGNHIQTWLNDIPRVDFHDTNPEHTTLKGFFGFQVHSGKSCDIQWRRIFIKELK